MTGKYEVPSDAGGDGSDGPTSRPYDADLLVAASGEEAAVAAVDANELADATSVHDLIGLTHLDESSILRALECRYDAGTIYTSTGPILIAVNPFRRMGGLYSDAAMAGYQRRGEGISSSPAGAVKTAKPNSDDNDGRRREERLPPHAYGTADDAYRAMKRGMEDAILMNSSPKSSASWRKGGGIGRDADADADAEHQQPRYAPADQSILVSGESGAGKTVTTKIVLNYFAMLSRHVAEEERRWRGISSFSSQLDGGGVSSGGAGRKKKGRHTVAGLLSPTGLASPTGRLSPVEDEGGTAAVGIEHAVLRSNPILEAFGNARTVRNDNSSRFGKYIDISFTSTGKLSGAKIDTYLLEKVRLIHPAVGERNYHVFYQFLEVASGMEREELGLGRMGPRDFRLLNRTGGTYHRRDGVEDGEMHREMLDAMVTIGFDEGTVSSILRLVAAILHCGNITFTAHDEDACTMDETHASLNAARLLGVEYEDLARAITSRAIRAGPDDVVHCPLDMKASTKGCEALMKAVYGAVFDYIVERVNGSILDQHNIATTGRKHHGADIASIGVLDIFGFEIFDTNNFEQLCINYTNEALQQQFNKYVFKLEQEEYEREGLSWKFISFPDNQDVLDLIDRRHTGVLALLDEQCIVASTDEKMTRYLYAKCVNHSRFSATSAQRADFRFSIEHYAGLVEYSTDLWLEKNKDQLPASSASLLMGSEFDLLAEIQKFIRSEDRDRRGSIITKSVGAQFSTQLSRLRSRIDATVPHYIRCLKPNNERIPESFNARMIVDQLRYGGVLEAVRVSRAGYPTRYPHSVFMARYYVLGYCVGEVRPMRQDVQDSDSEVKVLVAKISFDIWKADYQAMPNTASGQNNETGVAKKNSGTALCTTNGIAYPETSEEFLALDFSSRCAIAGLQLGKTKVFLRREALDRIEVLRTRKFSRSAAAIQRIVRGIQARSQMARILAATVAIQCAYRYYAVRRSYVKSNKAAQAAVKIQSFARGAKARMRYAAVKAREITNLREKLESATARGDELLAEKDDMQRKLETVEVKLVRISAAQEEAASQNTMSHGRLREELQSARASLHAIKADRDQLSAEKVLMLEEMSTIQEQMVEVSAAKDAEVCDLHNELDSVQQELEDVEGKAERLIRDLESQRGELSAANESVEDLSTKLHAANMKTEKSNQERVHLCKEISSLESQMDSLVKSLGANGGAAGEKTAEGSSNGESEAMDLTQHIESLSQWWCSVTRVICDVKETTDQEQQHLNETVSSLETDLLKSKWEKNEANLSHAAELENAKNVASAEIERFTSQLSSLESDLLESREERKRLDVTIQLLKTNHANALEALLTKVEHGNEKCSFLIEELQATKETASNDQDQLNAKINSLEASLLESKKEQERLESDMKSLETSHAGALTQLEEEKAILTNQNHEEQEKLNDRILSLESDLVASKEEGERLLGEMKLSVTSHADALRCLENEKKIVMLDLEGQRKEMAWRIECLETELKVGNEKYCSLKAELDDARATASQEQERVNAKVLSLHNELVDSKKKESRLSDALKSTETSKHSLENSISSLEREYEGQVRSCEAKLEPISSLNGIYDTLQQQDRSLDDMMLIIQKECANFIKKSKESVILEQQVDTLSKEASMYKLQNKGMIQVLDEMNTSQPDDGNHVEVLVDRVVDKRVISFCHKIEMPSTNSHAGMSVEVILLGR